MIFSPSLNHHKGVKMKKILYIFIIMIIFLNIIAPSSIGTEEENIKKQIVGTESTEEETMEEQQEEFGISDFIEKADKYSGEFFEDIHLNEILENAKKGEVDNQTLFQKTLSS